MKKQIILLVLALISLLGVNAQDYSALGFTKNSTGNHSKDFGSSCIDYVRAGGCYNNMSITGGGDYSVILNGIGLEGMAGIKLTRKLPIFVEAGLNFNANIGSASEYTNYDKISEKWTNINLIIPVNLVYQFAIKNDWSINPFVGLDLKCNLVMKEEISDGYYSPEYNCYKNFDWNRFQVEWQVGVGVKYKMLWLGLSYSSDFIRTCDWKDHRWHPQPRIDTSTFKLTVGNYFNAF